MTREDGWLWWWQVDLAQGNVTMHLVDGLAVPLDFEQALAYADPEDVKAEEKAAEAAREAAERSVMGAAGQQKNVTNSEEIEEATDISGVSATSKKQAAAMESAEGLAKTIKVGGKVGDVIEEESSDARNRDELVKEGNGLMDKEEDGEKRVQEDERAQGVEAAGSGEKVEQRADRIAKATGEATSASGSAEVRVYKEKEVQQDVEKKEPKVDEGAAIQGGLGGAAAAVREAITGKGPGDGGDVRGAKEKGAGKSAEPGPGGWLTVVRVWGRPEVGSRRQGSGGEEGHCRRHARSAPAARCDAKSLVRCALGLKNAIKLLRSWATCASYIGIIAKL